MGNDGEMDIACEEQKERKESKEKMKYPACINRYLLPCHIFR